MNECTKAIYNIADLQNVIDEAEPLLMACIDWRADHQSIASRSDVLRPYLNDLITQFADTLCHLANLGLDGGHHEAYPRIRDALKDAFDDAFEGEWALEKERAEDARRERVAA